MVALSVDILRFVARFHVGLVFTPDEIERDIKVV